LSTIFVYNAYVNYRATLAYFNPFYFLSRPRTILGRA